MLLNKGSKGVPILDGAHGRSYLPGFSLHTSGRCFALTPQMNRIATDIEPFTRFAFLQAIELSGFHHLFSEIVTVGLWHVDGLASLGTFTYPVS